MDGNKIIRKTQNRWENDVKNDLNIMKIRNWKTAFRTDKNGKESLRRPKHLVIKFAEPKEEEEEEEEEEELKARQQCDVIMLKTEQRNFYCEKHVQKSNRFCNIHLKYFVVS